MDKSLSSKIFVGLFAGLLIGTAIQYLFSGIAIFDTYLLGAAEGAGLGLRFLKHLARTKVVLVVIDMIDGEHPPLETYNILASELERYDETLAARERWIVLNKADVVPEDDIAGFKADFKKAGWTGPIYVISAISGQGTDALMKALMGSLGH